MVLGEEELYVSQEFEAAQQFLYVWAQLFGQFAQDADDFSLLVGFQFADAVVGFHHFRRFDEDGLARGTFVVDDARYSPLQGRRDGDDQPAVAHGWRDIFLYQSIFLGSLEDACQCPSDASLGAFQLVSDAREFAACLVLDASELVEYLLDALRDGKEGENAFGKFLEGRIVSLSSFLSQGISVPDYLNPSMQCLQRAVEFPQLLLFEVSAFDADAMNVGAQVEEVLLGQVRGGLQDALQLGKLLV